MLDAGETLAHEIGTFDFGVRDIVERAGVSLRTFYRYFETRDDFVLAIYARLNDRFARNLARTMPKGGRATRFRHVVYSMVVPAWWGPQYVAQRSAAIRETFRLREVRPEGFDLAVAPVRDILAGVLGRDRPNLTRDVETVHNSLLHEVYVIMLRRIIDAEPIAEHLYQHHRRGLRL